MSISLTSKYLSQASDPLLGRGESFPVDALRVFKYMLTSRVLDEKLAGLYRAGKVYGGVFLGKGQEALSAALGYYLRHGDVYCPLIRDGAGRHAFGEPIIDAVRTCLGSPLGPMRARDGNVHRGDLSRGYIPMISHLGATIAVVNGALMARKMKGQQGCVGASVVGDGATSTGAFHEALNQASVEGLPLIVVIANNHYAYSTPNDKQFACEKLEDRAKGYGMTARSVNGNDMIACMETIRLSLDEVRKSSRPQMIVASLLRLCGHGEHDDASYIDPVLRALPMGLDCMEVGRDQLLRREWISESEIEDWKREISNEIDAIISQVQQEPDPDPFEEDWCALSSRHLQDNNSNG